MRFLLFLVNNCLPQIDLILKPKQMKRILLFVMLVVSISDYAQIAITASYRGANEAFKKGELEKFKSTTTIFVLPELNKKEDYEKILNEVWTVTPFKVVEFKQFRMLDYVDGKYSFAKLDGDISRTSKGTVYVHANLVVEILDKEKFDKGFKKLNPEKKKYHVKLSRLFIDNLIYIARAPLSVNNAFLVDAQKARTDQTKTELFVRMYTSNSFTNTNLGMLKNYFQLINSKIEKGEHSGLYDDFTTSEVKNLKESILYIPDAYFLEFSTFTTSDKLKDESEIKKLLEAYKYKYQIIKNEELEKKILDTEPIYYLRYARMNGNKYLQIVNSKTGDPSFYYYGGLTYNLKEDDFKRINKAVEGEK